MEDSNDINAFVENYLEPDEHIEYSRQRDQHIYSKSKKTIIFALLVIIGVIAYFIFFVHIKFSYVDILIVIVFCGLLGKLFNLHLYFKPYLYYYITNKRVILLDANFSGERLYYFPIDSSLQMYYSDESYSQTLLFKQTYTGFCFWNTPDAREIYDFMKGKIKQSGQ